MAAHVGRPELQGAREGQTPDGIPWPAGRSVDRCLRRQQGRSGTAAGRHTPPLLQLCESTGALSAVFAGTVDAGGGTGAAGLRAAGILEPGRSVAAIAAQPLAPDRPRAAAGVAGLWHPVWPLAPLAGEGEAAPANCGGRLHLDGLLCVHCHSWQIGRGSALAPT